MILGIEKNVDIEYVVMPNNAMLRHVYFDVSGNQELLFDKHIHSKTSSYVFLIVSALDESPSPYVKPCINSRYVSSAGLGISVKDADNSAETLLS